MLQPVHSAEPRANPLLASTCSNVRRTRQGGAPATRPAGLLGGTLTPPLAAWPWGVIQRGCALTPRETPPPGLVSSSTTVGTG